MADDLDDDYWDQNEQVLASGSRSGEENDIEGSESSVEDSCSPLKKSKPHECEKDGAITTQEEKAKRTKRRRKRITDELESKGCQFETSDHLLAMLDQQFKNKLSPIEKDELVLDKDTNFHKDASEDDTPVSYMKLILPKWKKMLSVDLPPGSPIVLILSGSAVRCVQLNRELVPFKQENCKTAKLFAKHFKLKDQQHYLEKNSCHLAVGTPNRVHQLIKENFLRLDHVTSILLDWNWRDIKKKRMTDIPDVKNDLMLLLKDNIIPHVKKSSCRLGVL